MKKFIGSNTIPTSLYTDTDSLVQLEQLKLARTNQAARVVNFALSDYQSKFTHLFYEQIKLIKDPERAELLSHWGEFIKETDQKWAPHRARIMAAFNDSKNYNEVVAKEFAEYHDETKASWTELKRTSSES